MNRILATSLCAIVLALSVPFNNSAEAASQCVGLSSSACSSKSSQCTWRKASVNKNGNKTKAHCRALPGKANASKAKAKKKTSLVQSSTSSKKSTTTSDTKKKLKKKKKAKKKNS